MNEPLLTEKDGVVFCEGPRELLVLLYGEERVEPHPFLFSWGMVVLEPGEPDELQEEAA